MPTATQGYEYAAYVLSSIFFLSLLGIVVTKEISLRFNGSSLFFKKAPQPHKHGLFGFAYLLLLLLGFWHSSSLVTDSKTLQGTKQHMIIGTLMPLAVYDILLGLLGILLTLSASRDFPHKTVKNVASGTLDEHATVTYSEMMEHSFYQGLNLAQIIFFHFLTHYGTFLYAKIVLYLLLTGTWLLRDKFPVNKFSDNYDKKENVKSTFLIKALYRIKKYQYVFYKHFIFFGLSLSMVIDDTHSTTLVNYPIFRLFWILLNTSYVMEFFLQSLVKKNHITQTSMLILQHILMLAASLAAVTVLGFVNMYASSLSLVANFVRRKHDFSNSFFVMLVFLMVTSFNVGKDIMNEA